MRILQEVNHCLSAPLMRAAASLVATCNCCGMLRVGSVVTCVEGWSGGGGERVEDQDERRKRERRICPLCWCTITHFRSGRHRWLAPNTKANPLSHQLLWHQGNHVKTTGFICSVVAKLTYCLVGEEACQLWLVHKTSALRVRHLLATHRGQFSLDWAAPVTELTVGSSSFS